MKHNEQRTAVVLAGGGERVIAWQVGVLAGLADSGVDLRRAGTIVGTSAGAFVAARLAAGEDPRQTARRIGEREPEAISIPDSAPFEAMAEAYAAAGTRIEARRRIGALALAAQTASERSSVARAGSRLPDVEWPDALRVVAIDAERGERVSIDASAGASLAAGVAAARSVPTIMPPITVAGRRLIDGAIGSATNADIALHCNNQVDRVIVIAALPVDPAHAMLAELWNEALRAELWELDALRVETYIVRASANEMDVMGPDMMSGGAAPLAVRTGRHAGRTMGPALKRVLEPRHERRHRLQRTPLAATLAV